MKRHALFLNRRLGGLLVGWMLLCLIGSGLAFWPDVYASDHEPPTPASHRTRTDLIFLFLPLIQTQVELLSTPQPTPAPRHWDVRLDARGTVLHTATPSPGQGYWRLVSARWYDEEEAGGRHHILVDLLDPEGKRMVDLPLRIYWSGGETIIQTQAKPNEPYAADFAMFDVAPSYGAAPLTGDPTDALWGMGLGSIDQPKFTIHSSYGLVWQWTIYKDAATASPTPTATRSSLEETQTPIASPVATATVTTTPTPEPAPQWDARLDERGIVYTAAEVRAGQGYWRLVSARWYDEQESGGRRHILMNLLDADGGRIVGAPMRIYWNGGETILYTEAKPGESYAAHFGMTSIGPSYGAMPADGQPADSVWGMGLGSIEQPHHAIQTSVGLVWQWRVKPSSAEENTGSNEPSPTLTAAP
jgi:hypothetical protein